MRYRFSFFLLFLVFAISGLPQLGAQEQAKSPASADVLETVEWTWAAKPDTTDNALPNVLLIGDSITRGYYPKVAELLKDHANCYLFASSTSSGDSRLNEHLNDYFRMMNLSFAVVHFNNGMHGWGYTEKAYAAGLPGMVDAIRSHQPQARLIWATTTPVHKDAPNGATNSRIDERNALALKIMEAEKVTIDDQHTLMLAHDNLHTGAMHYTEKGSEVQAQQVAYQIEAGLTQHPAPVK